MKMRLAGFLMFAILSVSIISYGFNGSVFADSHNIPPISATTELPTYENGDRVFVDGSIRDYDSDLHSNTALKYCSNLSYY
jgi:signal peptidase I